MAQKIVPIRDGIREVLERFLSSEEHQEFFASEAAKLGYKGTDKDKIRVALFLPDENGEICFANSEINDKFVAFQILEELSKIPAFKEIIDNYPEMIPALIEDSKIILEVMYNE